MSSVSTRETLKNVNVEVYRAMAPALGIHPESRTVSERAGDFPTRDDQFISKGEQAKMNPFMREVANDVRTDHGGYCPSQVLYREAGRRMKAAIRSVAGKKDTADGKLLSKSEVGRIRNPLLRAMVERAAEARETSTTSSSSWSDNDSSSGSSSAGAGHGPHYYGDMPPDGPYVDDGPSMGPDGPNRRYNDPGWGPDSTHSEPGCGRGYSGGDTVYVGGYPLI